MKRILILLALSLGCSLGYSSTPRSAQGDVCQSKNTHRPARPEGTFAGARTVIPQPSSLSLEEGFYLLPNGWKAEKAKHRRDGSLPEEAYRLTITPRGVTITASTKKGFFYGEQTLRQLLQQSDGQRLRCLTIDDAPRFAYRGLMLDVVRYFIPKEHILKIIDIAASLKMNNLHLHLTDDNGWRIEIKKYPRLTSVGAWRVARNTYFQNRENPREGEPTPVGGFYTQRDLRDIVAYAKQRHVNIVPEIEMPAHSVAAIAAYPEMTCPVMGDRFIGVLPGIGGKDASIIYCAGNERVYSFLQDILDEVMDIFPSEYIHLGGDEAEKSHWRACPLCQQQMQREGLYDIEQLQGRFMDRMIRYLNSKGRRAMGWDEVVLGSPQEDITIFGWQGYGQAAIRDARKSGRPFILTPARLLYLIRYQGPQWFEPYTYFGNNTLHDVYSYEPVADDWTPSMEHQLQGIQASLWTEFCLSPSDVDYLLFPRLMALADNAWRAKGTANWSQFVQALDAYLPFLEERGIGYARSMYNISHTVSPNDGLLLVELACERPDVEIRFTMNGDEPTADSQRYLQPILTDAGITLKAATFRDGQQMGKTLTLPLVGNRATGCTVLKASATNGLADRLTNGVRGSLRHSDFEWAGWYDTDADFTIDLADTVAISSVTLGAIANANMTVALPREVRVDGSIDGEVFVPLGEVSLTDADIFAREATRRDIVVPLISHQPSSITHYRYLRVQALHPGTIPEGFIRGGQSPWMYFDEIIVE